MIQQELFQSVFSKYFSGGIRGFQDAIGIEEEFIAREQLTGLLFIFGEAVGKCTQQGTFAF